MHVERRKHSAILVFRPFFTESGQISGFGAFPLSQGVLCRLGGVKLPEWFGNQDRRIIVFVDEELFDECLVDGSTHLVCRVVIVPWHALQESKDVMHGAEAKIQRCIDIGKLFL
ncbi:hypothetical protein [Glutamicibacter sp. AOP5-A2-18]|uniref:hypothetical protein n=1 Tax=Glutamicibacter sp. AOP5-A2-18 TaxID=3457656 RepID=UPI004034B302